MNPINLAAGTIGLAGGLGAMAIFHPRVNLFGPVVWHGPRVHRRVALTFDDGPHPEFTRRISEILEKYDCRATFFCIGSLAEKHAPLVRQLFESGHEIQNHTHQHNTAGHLFSANRLTDDLCRCQEVLTGITGTRPVYYRPAAGVKSPPVHWAANRTQLCIVSWSLAARDGVWPLSRGKALEIANRARSGDIIALHDGTLSGNRRLREGTLENLPILLGQLRQREFRTMTLTQLLQVATA